MAKLFASEAAWTPSESTLDTATRPSSMSSDIFAMPRS